VLSPRGDGSFTLEDGTIAGRASVLSLLAQLARVRANPDAGALCGQPAALQALFAGQICNAVDIAANSSTDGLPSTKCDALSLAQGFRADPAFAGDPTVAGPGPCDGVMPPSCQ
jgi:hypothetical protein